MVLVPAKDLHALAARVPPVAVHDKRDVLGDGTSLEHGDDEALCASEGSIAQRERGRLDVLEGHGGRRGRATGRETREARGEEVAVLQTLTDRDARQFVLAISFDAFESLRRGRA